jgi:cell division septation protein DedD
MASSRRKIMDMERKLNLTKSTTGKSERIASALAKPAKLRPSEQAAAAAVINPRRVLDQSRALARAKGSVARAEKKAAAEKMLKATTGGTAAKKPASKPAAKKAPAKKVRGTFGV